MTRTYKTLNSVYEVDEVRKRVRRVSGRNDPTPNFNSDGEWHDYAALALLPRGNLVFYFLDGRTTITSVAEEAK